MPVSYQDYVLYSQATGAPLPRNPQERMQMAPQVYDFTRQIGSRPSRLQQGLRAVGRGLAVAGGAGLAIGVANSLFNKPSDNYRQSVTNNQTTVGKDARTATQTTYDEANTTVAEDITGKASQFLSNTIGPHPVGTESKKDLKYLNNVRSRFGRMQAQGFSSGLRNEDPAANIAAAQSQEYQISDKEAADIAAAENTPDSPTVQAAFPSYKTKISPEERARIHITNKETDKGFLRETEEADRIDSAMGIDPPKPPSSGNISERVEEFINKSNKGLPEKKTPEITDLREYAAKKASGGLDIVPSGEPPADMAKDLKEFDDEKNTSDFYYKGTGETEKKATTPQDVSPRGVIPPDKSGTMNKTDLGAIGDIIGEKQADNPIVGGLQGIGKAARIAGKIGKRTVEELADKGAKDRRNYAKYKETVRKAKAFKKIADDRENTETPE